MIGFQATNRVGHVLSAKVLAEDGVERIDSLNWSQAEKVLRLLDEDYRGILGDAQFNAVQAYFHEMKLGRRSYEKRDRPLKAHENRGQIFHSDYVVVDLDGVVVYLSFTYTVCVSFPIPDSDEVNSVQSKFWFSALIVSDASFNESELAKICDDAAQLSEAVLEATRGTYQRAINEVTGRSWTVSHDPKVNMVDTIIEIPDENFLSNVRSIEDRQVTLSQVDDSKALSVLNGIYSGNSWETFLYCGRGKESQTSCVVDSVIEAARSQSPAFYIETRQGTPEGLAGEDGKAGYGLLGLNQKSLGVIQRPSSFEKSDVSSLSRSTGSRISAQRVAELGELF